MIGFNMTEFKYKKNHFEKAKEVEWGDVISKINHEFQSRTNKVLIDKEKYLHIPPTFVTQNDFYPNSIGKAYSQVASCVEVYDMHMYVSLGKNSSNFGRHKDTMDVIIVQSIGKTSYIFDSGEKIDLNPGDSLYIPKGVYHCPIIEEPRVTLSFGV